MPDFSISTPTPATLATGPRIGRSVSIDRAAELLGCSRRTVYNLISSGWLQTVRTLGRSQRVLLESLQMVADRGTRNLSRVGGGR
jgi:excisionase family DNA binding protein